MKKLIFVLLAAFALSSCGVMKSPVMGLVYTDVKDGLMVTSNAASSKVGTAEAKSILGIAAFGDASIQAAAKQGGITKVHHVDCHVFSILGIYSTYTLVVYGQ